MTQLKSLEQLRGFCLEISPGQEQQFEFHMPVRVGILEQMREEVQQARADVNIGLDYTNYQHHCAITIHCSTAATGPKQKKRGLWVATITRICARGENESNT